MNLRIFKNTFRGIGWFVCLLVSCFSCEEKELLYTGISTEGVAFQEVEVSSISFDRESNQLIITIPYGTSVNALTPIFSLNGPGEAIPASGTSQNFSQPVYYTVIHPSGGKRVYQFVVRQSEQPSPVITSLSTQEITAGESLTITGQNFGNFSLAIKTALLNNERLITGIPFQLVDQNNLKLVIPDTVKAGSYKISISVNGKSVTSSGDLKVIYPAPQLKSLTKLHVLPNDTVAIVGRFLDEGLYQYRVVLKGEGGSELRITPLPSSNNQGTTLLFTIPSNAVAGKYNLSVVNETINKAATALALQVYDPTLPFVTSIVNKKAAYTAGENLVLSTVNFDKSQARFYQVTLINDEVSIAQNGMYNANNKQLTIKLPTSVGTGSYKLSFNLFNPPVDYIYNFQTDLIINIQ